MQAQISSDASEHKNTCRVNLVLSSFYHPWLADSVEKTVGPQHFAVGFVLRQNIWFVLVHGDMRLHVDIATMDLIIFLVPFTCGATRIPNSVNNILWQRFNDLTMKLIIFRLW